MIGEEVSLVETRRIELTKRYDSAVAAVKDTARLVAEGYRVEHAYWNDGYLYVESLKE